MSSGEGHCIPCAVTLPSLSFPGPSRCPQVGHFLELVGQTQSSCSHYKLSLTPPSSACPACAQDPSHPLGDKGPAPGASLIEGKGWQGAHLTTSDDLRTSTHPYYKLKA